jgi:hypothetical protein
VELLLQNQTRLHQQTSGAPPAITSLAPLAFFPSSEKVFFDRQDCRHSAAVYILRYPLLSLAHLVFTFQRPASAKLLHINVVSAIENYVGAQSGQAPPNTTTDANSVRAAESKVTLETCLEWSNPEIRPANHRGTESAARYRARQNKPFSGF